VLLTVLGVVAVIGAVHFGLLHSYQLQRFTSFINQGSGSLQQNYNLDQSKAAVANGGFWGTGLFRGTQTNLGYVPYQWTDFIFSAIGEQLGFVGCSVVLGLFALLALRMIRAVQLTTDRFGRLLCAGALAFITFSVFQSVGMAIGLLPIAGIPLPFISEGGSAVLAFFASAGLVVNVELRRPVMR
jgi:rod shape determining protein RodA